MACLVKDNPQRSYFIRVFDIKVSGTICKALTKHQVDSVMKHLNFGKHAYWLSDLDEKIDTNFTRVMNAQICDSYWSSSCSLPESQ